MSIYEFDRFQLNSERLSLTHAGHSVELGRKVVATLLALIEHAGEMAAKDALLDRIWPEGFVEEANLAQNIYVLRRMFRSYGTADPIETIPRRGYRFTVPVRRLADVSPSQAAIAITPARNVAPARLKPGLLRWAATAIAGAVFVVTSLVLVAAYGLDHRAATPHALSERGARLYEVGRYYWNLRTRDGVQKSLAFFAQVVDTDPNDARGYAALAESNAMMGDYCYGTHQPALYFARAREYAKKALALDPNSAEAHAALGVIALDVKDVTAAVGELRHAMALDPTYGPAQEWYGIALIRQGRVSEGVAHLKIAANLDPLSVATTAWLGWAAYREHRFGDAIFYSRQALELSPQRTDALSTIGEAYEAKGEINGAIDAFKRFAAVDRYYRPEAAALLAHAYALAHRMPEARAQLAYARAHAGEVDPGDLAAAIAAVGAGKGAPRLPQHYWHTATYA